MMFFRILFRNPKGVEVAVNLAAMFIHFQKQKAYILASVNNTLAVMENKSEKSFNKHMTGKSIQKPALVPEVHC